MGDWAGDDRVPEAAAAGDVRAARPAQAAASPRRPLAGGAHGASRRAGAARVPGQAALDPLLRPPRRRPRRHDRPAGRPARRAGGRDAAAAARPGAHHGGRPWHDAQDPVAPLRRRARRVGADALPRPRHDVRLVAGRVRHGVPLLRHRAGRPPAQHVDRRDRRAGGRRSPVAGPGRGARRSRPASPTSCSWAWASRWPTTRP